jgi:hypothetical protein
MQARFYAPMYGRFLSPDPARDQHFEQTQSWNIYSYVQNDPTMRIDPTGMFGDPEPFYGWAAWHAGVMPDPPKPAAAPTPTPSGGTVHFRKREYKRKDLEVHAIRSGTVVDSKKHKGYGPQVLVASDASNGKSGDRYAHLDPQVPKEGTHVNAGDVIGSVAATDPLPGRNTGPHLHHEVIPDLTKPGETVKPDSGDAKSALPSSQGRSSGYGERQDPLDPSKKQFHRGEDITPPFRTLKN